MIPQIICMFTGFIFGAMLVTIGNQADKIKHIEEHQDLKIENGMLKEINNFYRKELGLECRNNDL